MSFFARSPVDCGGMICEYGIEIRRKAYIIHMGPTTIAFPTKNDHFGVFWGYHHLRKHPYVYCILLFASVIPP